MPEASTVDDVMDEITETVDYVREHGLKDVVNGVTSWAKGHPTHALIGAVALGFLIAVLVRRR